MNKITLLILIITISLIGLPQVDVSAQTSGVLPISIVTEKISVGDEFPVASTLNGVAALRFDKNDYPGVLRAVNDLQNDINTVVNQKPMMLTNETAVDYEIIIGTIGHSKEIDRLIATKKVNVQTLKGKWESFVITTISSPKAGAKKCLAIIGSDKRGTIYGIYELSQQLGVSPWYWWADVPVKKKNEAYVKSGYYASGEPKVKYRGIFINDEAPCFTGWCKEKFGGVNSKMYTRMFETVANLDIPKNADGTYTLNIRMIDPGVVIYKIVIDNGGYEPTHLKMPESPYKR